MSLYSSGVISDLMYAQRAYQEATGKGYGIRYVNLPEDAPMIAEWEKTGDFVVEGIKAGVSLDALIDPSTDDVVAVQWDAYESGVPASDIFA